MTKPKKIDFDKKPKSLQEAVQQLRDMGTYDGGWVIKDQPFQACLHYRTSLSGEMFPIESTSFSLKADDYADAACKAIGNKRVPENGYAPVWIRGPDDKEWRQFNVSAHIIYKAEPV